MGYEPLVADYYWLSAIQYYGAPEYPALEYRHLADILELVTDLDPLFGYAYVFGGAAIPQHLPRGGWANADKAVALLEKGVRRVPGDWRIGMFLGYSRLWYFDDVAGAAEAFDASARAPGRPRFIPLLATRLRAEAHTPELGLRLAHDVLRNTDDPQLREELEQRLVDLEFEIVLQRLERAIASFRKNLGRAPRGLAELASEGILPREDVEAYRPRVTYDAGTGKVSARATQQRLLRSELARTEREKDARGTR